MTQDRVELVTTQNVEAIASPGQGVAPPEVAAELEAAPVALESVEETVVHETRTYTVYEPAYAPRSKWDFTEGQRIIIGVLLWLNILIATLAWLVLTGRFNP